MMHTASHNFAMILSGLIKGIITVPAWIIIGLIGFYVWEKLGSPLTYLVGLPLMLVGASMTIISFYEMVLSLVSSRWRITHCPYCESPKGVKEILSIHNDFQKRTSAEDDIHRLHI